MLLALMASTLALNLTFGIVRVLDGVAVLVDGKPTVGIPYNPHSKECFNFPRAFILNSAANRAFISTISHPFLLAIGKSSTQSVMSRPREKHHDTSFKIKAATCISANFISKIVETGSGQERSTLGIS